MKIPIVYSVKSISYLDKTWIFEDHPVLISTVSTANRLIEESVAKLLMNTPTVPIRKIVDFINHVHQVGDYCFHGIDAEIWSEAMDLDPVDLKLVPRDQGIFVDPAIFFQRVDMHRTKKAEQHLPATIPASVYFTQWTSCTQA